MLYVESIEPVVGTDEEIFYNTSITDQATSETYYLLGLVTNSMINTEGYFKSLYNSGKITYSLSSDDIDMTYNLAILLSGFVTRGIDFTSDHTDSITSQTASSFFVPNLLGQKGGYSFVIRNVSSTYGLTITAPAEGWSLDTNANWIVGPEKTVSLMFHLDSSNKTITVYMIGKSDLNG
jgi:hypothetical protein